MTRIVQQSLRWGATFCMVILIFAVSFESLAVGNEKKRSPNPLSGDKQAITEGKTIFRANCAYCHGVRANGRGRGLPNSADLRKFKRGYSKFVHAVKKGWKTMPPWGGMGELTDEQIDQIGAYLETLAVRGAKWQDTKLRTPAPPQTVLSIDVTTLLPSLLELLVPSAHADEAGHKKHLARLDTANPDAPGGVGLIAILEEEIEIARQHAALAIKDLEDLKSIKMHTRHVRHAIAPDKEPAASGPGKGFGALLAANDMVRQLQLASDSTGVSDADKSHTNHVMMSAKNIAFWSSKILDKAGQITGGASPVASAFFAEEIVEHLNWILEGRDANQDGTISWDEGEGGLAQVKQHLALIKR